MPKQQQMSSEPDENRGASVILEVGCFQNLYASGQLDLILRESGYSFAIERHVLNSEIRSLFTQRNGEFDTASFEKIEHILDVVSINTDAEAVTMLKFVEQLGDNEARTLAMALHRGYLVATDDPKATWLLRTMSQTTKVLTTPALVYEWIYQTGRSADAQAIIARIETGAAYRPKRADVYFKWWISVRDGHLL